MGMAINELVSADIDANWGSHQSCPSRCRRGGLVSIFADGSVKQSLYIWKADVTTQLISLPETFHPIAEQLTQTHWTGDAHYHPALQDLELSHRLNHGWIAQNTPQRSCAVSSNHHAISTFDADYESHPLRLKDAILSERRIVSINLRQQLPERHGLYLADNFANGLSGVVRELLL